MEIYRHSGTVPIGGAILTGVVGLVTALVCGVIYTFAVAYIPFIYLNFLFTLGFGAAIGCAVSWGSTAGKIRNTFLVTAIAWVCALLGIYTEWGVTPIALVGWNEIGLFGFDPLAMFAFMQFLYQEGSWGISGDQNLTGIPLLCVWLIEAGVVIGMTHVMSRVNVGIPFCEQCDQWTTPEEGVRLFQGTGDEPQWASVQSGNVEVLNDMTLLNTFARTAVRLDLATCPVCKDSAFLTIQAASYEIDKDGDLKESLTPIATNLTLGPGQAEVVLNSGREPPEVHDHDDDLPSDEDLTS
jgi:hypothetical protein